MNKLDILSQSNLFRSISKTHLQQVANICLQKMVQKKQTLFTEGDRGSALYILVTGAIQLFKSDLDGGKVVIKIVKPGEMFAEIILFESNQYPVTAVALKTSSLFILPKHQFSCLMKDDLFMYDFLSTMMKKMRYLTNQIKYLSIHDVEKRFFLFLEEQFGDFKQTVCYLSKKDVASAIGTSPETLSRLLFRLRKQKRLVWEGKTISIF